MKDFVRINRLHGKTNGKILIFSEMIAPGSFHIDLGRNLLPQLGMIYGSDFIFIEEQLICGVGGMVSDLLNKEIPECKDISWLVIRLYTKWKLHLGERRVTYFI